jgi:hypothetical protein
MDHTDDERRGAIEESHTRRCRPWSKVRSVRPTTVGSVEVRDAYDYRTSTGETGRRAPPTDRRLLSATKRVDTVGITPRATSSRSEFPGRLSLLVPAPAEGVVAAVWNRDLNSSPPEALWRA